MRYLNNAFNYRNYAYGLDYDESKAEPYTIANIRSISSNDSLNESTRNKYLATLENWKKRTGEEKPKLIIVNSADKTGARKHIDSAALTLVGSANSMALNRSFFMALRGQ